MNNDLKRDNEIADVLLNLAPKIIEKLHEGIIIVDDTLNIVFVNESSEWMFDALRDQLIGKSINTLLPERFRNAHTGHTAHYLEHPKARPMSTGVQLFAVTSKGREFPVEISLTPFKTRLGTFIVAVVHRQEQVSHVVS